MGYQIGCNCSETKLNDIETGGVDMCKALERKYQEKEVTGAITGMKLMGASDNDIIAKITEQFKVTKEYVLALLKAQVA